eukprot:jgi/Psemu1/327492/estExt_fgenesh1_pg.C_6830008
MAKKTIDKLDYKDDGCDSCDDGNSNCDDENYEEDDDAVQAAYDKSRDDQVNTGVIAALLGGFALTNSWEMDLGADTSRIDLAAYTLAILSVHGCTCSALASAFLYRSLTRKSPRAALAWLHRHHTLAQLPWCKFMLGTLCYVASVCSVAWSSLEMSPAARWTTLFAGVSGCMFIMYTFWITCTEEDDDDDAPYIVRKRGRRYRHKQPSGT